MTDPGDEVRQLDISLTKLFNFGLLPEDSGYGQGISDAGGQVPFGFDRQATEGLARGVALRQQREKERT